jgi:hypothetical protein
LSFIRASLVENCQLIGLEIQFLSICQASISLNPYFHGGANYCIISLSGEKTEDDEIEEEYQSQIPTKDTLGQKG